MKILVIGSGGREHALSWKLAQEAEVVCAPGNPGIGEDVTLEPVAVADTDGLLQLAKKLKPDLVVVGPEDPLITGLADVMREAGFATYGPGAAGARLEGSKAFSKDLMADAGIPTAKFRSFTRYDEAYGYALAAYGQGRKLAVKASGTALGRGVVVAESLEEALSALERMMVRKEFGTAGDTVVLEELLRGREFSVLTIVGERNFVSLPVAQDYKRALDGDEGPNTGGMGTYSPCEWVSPTLIEQVEATMIVPTLEMLKAQGISFRGTLFTGAMMTERGPFCLEYNVRFGDPEIQSVVMRLGRGLAQALLLAASGGLIERPEVKAESAVTTIVACTGYPRSYEKGKPMTVGTIPEGAKLFWAGVAQGEDGWITSGGRVVGASATGPTLDKARDRAFQAAEAVQFDGAYFRRDIGC